MHTRRIAGFLLGALTIGCLIVDFAAAENLRGVERIMQSPAPEASKMVQALGYTQARALLRYAANEANRFDFETWEWTEIVLGAGLLLVTLAGTRGNKFATLVCVAILCAICFQRFFIRPEIVWLGRAFDFAPLDGATAQRNRYWTMRQAYDAIEVLKLLLSASLAGYLFIFRAKLRGKLQPQLTCF
ncbi:MAG: hypothetical protein ABI165_13225 [Bryobacteraceae bacterium]